MLGVSLREEIWKRLEHLKWPDEEIMLKKIFFSSKFPLSEKEVSIMNYLVKKVTEDSTYRSEEVYKFFLLLLKSTRFQSIIKYDENKLNSLGIINLLQTIFSDCRSKHQNLSFEIAKYFFLLKPVYYWARGSLTSCIELMIKLVSCLFFTEDASSDNCSFVTNIIKEIHKWARGMTFQLSHYNNILNSHLFPLISLMYEMSLSNVSDLSLLSAELVYEVESFTYSLLFPQELLVSCENLINYLFSSGTSSFPDELVNCFDVIVNIMENKNIQIGSVMYQTVFRGLCSKYKTSKIITQYSALVLTCHLLRINPTYNDKTLIVSGKLTHVPKFNGNQMLVVLKHVVQSIELQKLDLSVTIDNVTFLHWLQSLVSYLVTNRSERSAAWCEVLESLTKLAPAIVEPNLVVLFQTVLFGEIQGIKSSCTQFMLFLMDTFCAVRQMPKYLSKLLQSIGYAPNERLVKFYFPEELFSKFKIASSSLPILQTSQLWYILVKCCSEEMFPSSYDDQQLIKLSEVTLTFLSEFFYNYKLSESNIPKKLQENFAGLNVETHKLLKNFGEFIFSNEFDEDFIQTYLKVVYSWGELRTIDFIYGHNEWAEMDEHAELDDLSLIHNFLGEKEWKSISHKIVSFSQGPSLKILVKLQLQKFKFLKLLMNTKNCPVNHLQPLVQFLVDNFELTNDQFIEVLPFLMEELIPIQIIKLCNCIVDQLCDPSNLWRPAIGTDYYQQSPPLQMGLLWSLCLRLLKSLSRVKRKSNEQFTQSTLHKFHCKLVDKFELVYCHRKMLRTEDSKDVMDFFTELSQTLWNQIQCCNKGLIHGVINVEDVSELLSCLSLLTHPKLFPASQMFVTMTMITLLSHFQELKDFTESGLVTIIYKIMHNIFCKSDSFQLFSYFNSGDLMVWLLEYEKNLAHSHERHLQFLTVFEALALKLVRGAQVLLDCNNLVNYLSHNVHPAFFPCIASLSKTFIENKSQNTEEARKAYIKILSKGLSATLANSQSNLSTEVYLTASKLICDYKLAKFEKHGIKWWDKYFKDPLEKSLLLLETCSLLNEESAASIAMSFIELVCQNRKILLKFADSSFTLRLWEIIKKHAIEAPTFSVLKCCQHDKFAVIVRDMQELTQASCSLDRPTWLLNYWRELAGMRLILHKNKVRTHALTAFLSDCRNIIAAPLPDITLTRILEICQILVSNDNISLSKDLLLTIINIAMGIQLNLQNSTTVFHSIYHILNAAFLFQTAAMCEIIPVFIQCLRDLIVQLCHHGNQGRELLDLKILEYQECARLIERIITLISGQKVQFSKVIPYLLADIIYQFHKVLLYPAVKKPLEQSVFVLLSVCDEHGISNLRVALPDDSKELFKHLYDTYERYYKYKGKI